jgi:hypothetical protein
VCFARVLAFDMGDAVFCDEAIGLLVVGPCAALNQSGAWMERSGRLLGTARTGDLKVRGRFLSPPFHPCCGIEEWSHNDFVTICRRFYLGPKP